MCYNINEAILCEITAFAVLRRCMKMKKLLVLIFVVSAAAAAVIAAVTVFNVKFHKKYINVCD